MRNKQYARQIIESNAEECGMSVKEYAEYSAQEDPTFYQFLFPEENVGDYGVKMTAEQTEEAELFIQSL